MAQTTKRYQIIQKIAEDETLLLHPETDAEVVLFDGSESGLSSGNLKAAVNEVAGQVKKITDGGVVTGVKGENETEYRKGQVSLSAENVGAEKAGTVATHNADGTAHSDIRTAVSNAQSKADQAYALAEGKSKAVSFATLDELKAALKGATKTNYKVGDNLYIKEKGMPDYWVSAILETNEGECGYFEITELESEKVDLSGYQQKTDNSLATTDKTIVGAIGEVKGTADSAKSASETNTSNITKIVDGTTKVAKATAADTAVNATTAESATKLAAARKIAVNVNSGVKADGSSQIAGNGEQNFDGSADKSIEVALGDSGVTAGTYSAIQVNAKGIAVAGGQMFEVGTSGQKDPSASLATGGLFFKML
jgi:hypothetical protein